MAFAVDAALIALREGLEALLITGILVGLVTRLDRPDARKHVWAGFGAAVATSVLAGWAIERYLLAAFEQRGWGAAFELVAALAAVVTLLYMVFWMWSHTSKVLSEAKDRVRIALTTGSLATIVFITYISTVREGLETVLFYSALTSQHSLSEILWSGAVGFAASALLVYVILRTSRHVSVRSFFTATGLWLIVVAAMLTTHAVGAATELGLLEPAPAIWDTSAIVAADSVTGRVLHATVGYMPAPSLLQALTYFGTLFGAGFTYLHQQGLFTRSTTTGKEPVGQRVAAAAIAVLLVGSLVATAAANPTDRMIAGHSHGAGEEDHHGTDAVQIPEDATVGVLLRNHGEPIHYNETTYQSFANFTRALLEMLGYGALLEIDHGTVLLDDARPFTHEPHPTPDLVDAWLDPHDGPAAYVGSPVPSQQQVPFADGYYVAPGGPGLGEPDVLEMAGLGAYKAWIQMEGTSPMHGDKSRVLDLAEHRLEDRSGEQVQVFRAFSIRPFVGPNHSFDAVADQIAQADPDVLVDAYTSHLHSDVMDTCMMWPKMAQALDAAGYEGPVVHAGPSGLNETFADGIAAHVQTQLDRYPDDAKVSVHLTHHGLDPGAQSPCRDRADPYNDLATEMFEHTEAALDARNLSQVLEVRQVYGQGADGEDDGVLSPTEALEEADADGATHVLDVPYELPGDGFDNLVNHRLHYGFQPENAPHYDANYETHFIRYGMPVTILSSAFAADERAQAQVHVIEQALDDAIDRLPSTTAGPGS